MKCKLTLFAILCLLAHGAMQAQSVQTDSLKRLLALRKQDTAKANIYNHLADQFRESNPDSTVFYANKAAGISQKAGYNAGLAGAFLNKGNAAVILGDYSKAMSCFKKAQSTYNALLPEEESNNSIISGLARSYAGAGVVYSEQSNYYMALENYKKALLLYQKTGQQVFIAKVYNNIGIVYKSQQNYPKALEYLKKALAIQERTGGQAVAMTYTNIGVIYFESNRQPEALPYYQKAAQLFPDTGNLRGFALLKNYLGDYYKWNKDAETARQYYDASLSMYENLQNKFGASLSLYKIAQLLADGKQFDKALPFAAKSLQYAHDIGALDQAYHSEELLSTIYSALGKPSESLQHYKNYVTARDSIAKLENDKKFALAEMNFEYRKKEELRAEQSKRQSQLLVFSILGAVLLTVLALVLYNRRQVKKRLTLEKEVSEYEQKALHLQMNPHFVFNCLSSISSFIVQNGTDSALKYLSKFSKLMRLTLEYSKDSLIPIDKEIESLQNYLELEQLRFHNKFEYRIGASDNVEFNMGLPPLLIQPFVENAILHGIVPKEGNGTIEVYFDVKAGQLICTITDDGIGLTQSRMLKEHSVTAHKSMALEITKKRLEIMESTTSKSAQIEIAELEKGKGTAVILRLPIQYIP